MIGSYPEKFSESMVRRGEFKKLWWDGFGKLLSQGPSAISKMVRRYGKSKEASWRRVIAAKMVRMSVVGS